MLLSNNNYYNCHRAKNNYRNVFKYQEVIKKLSCKLTLVDLKQASLLYLFRMMKRKLKTKLSRLA